MEERRYSVSELDALRDACENKWLFGSYSPVASRSCSRSYKEEEKTRCVEQMVRTHMMAGHTADDLYAEADKLITRQRAMLEADEAAKS